MSEMPTEHFEHAEHAEHAHHAAAAGNPFMGTVAITIAVLAVVAATTGSLETVESGLAISAKNEAVLAQDKATDSWAFYQAKSIKKNMFEIAAAGGGATAEDFTKQAKRYELEGEDIQGEAKKLEAESADHLKESDVHEHRHHILTVAVTLLHVAIAIATISIIAGGKRWPWLVSLLLGVGGIVGTGYAFLVG